MSATLDDLVEWLAEKNWSPETRRAHRSAVRTFYAWAKETGRVRKNPAAKLPVVRARRPAARPAAEYDITMAYAKADRRQRLAIRLAADLGLRCAEAAVVHTRDLVERDGRFSLIVHGKGQKMRVLPLTDSLAGALRAAPEGYLFPGKVNGHISPHHLGKLVSSVLPAGVTMHMLRHRFATLAYNVDRDVFTVQQLLGHASPTTTQGYVQIHEDHMRRLVEAVAS
ncbi:MAG: integrase [Microbacteriaceae bacterium]|nr:MAG: integrase [Microbacteriaceae bacterium]